MRNPIQNIYDALPEDGTSVILTKDFCKQVLAWMRAADPKFSSMEHVDKLLWYIHGEGLVILSFTETSDGRVNFIRRNLNGNKTGKV